MRAPVNDALAIDDQRLRRRLALISLPAGWQQLLTEQNVFRALTFILFCSVVFVLLFYCDFLPYGTDNNETFSSILHAKNMYLHGAGSTYGLTSETTSPIDVVQFVYTHQGNFPRFYALLLYAVGARSAEAQILITTLTIGSASIFFAHVYMERRVNALFAFIFCSVLITDYIMGLQWFVNTWRVWPVLFRAHLRDVRCNFFRPVPRICPPTTAEEADARIGGIRDRKRARYLPTSHANRVSWLAGLSIGSQLYILLSKRGTYGCWNFSRARARIHARTQYCILGQFHIGGRRIEKARGDAATILSIQHDNPNPGARLAIAPSYGRGMAACGGERAA